MAVPWGAVVFVFGLAYGYFSPGRTTKWRIFKKGLLIGIVLAIVLSLLGEAVNAGPLGLGRGFWSVLWGVVVLTLLFILGTVFGDLLDR